MVFLRDCRGLTCCVGVASSNFALREKDWIQISVSRFFASKSAQPRNRVLLPLSIFNLGFPGVHTLFFFQTCLNQRPYSFKRGFSGKKFSNRSNICDVSSEKLLLKHVFLWSSDWGNTETLNFHWKSTMLRAIFLPEYNAPTFHSGLNQKRSTCKRVLLRKIGGFVPFVTKPIAWKFWEKPSFPMCLVIQIDLSQQLQLWVH